MPDQHTPPPIVGRVKVPIMPEPIRSLGGQFASAMPHQFERRDPALHHQLSAAWLPEPAPEAPPPPAPTETELRAQLREALHRQKSTNEVLRAAEAAHTRAEQHRRDCQHKLAAYAGLNAAMAEAVAGALRSGDDPVLAQEPFAQRLAEREQAQADLTAADSAVGALLRERSNASKLAGNVTTEVDRLATQLLAFVAEETAHEIRVLNGEINRRRKSLMGFDRVATAAGLGLSRAVGQALGEPSAQELVGVDIAPWRKGRTQMVVATP
jgi:hypothetical protein